MNTWILVWFMINATGAMSQSVTTGLTSIACSAIQEKIEKLAIDKVIVVGVICVEDKK